MKNSVLKLMMVCSLFLFQESLSAQIIGNNSEGTLSDWAGNAMAAIRYQCTQNMTVTKMYTKIASSGSGNIKCAIYSDNSGNPGTFLMGTNELTNPGNGWKLFNLTSGLSLTSGAWYHLVVWPSSNYAISYTTAGVGTPYRVLTYGTWPGSFGTASSWPDGTYCIYAEGTVGCSNPVITNHPLSISRDIGSSATFSVSATGTNPTYQWKKDGSDITGATSSSYTKNPVASGDAGSYTVVVSACGTSVTSNVATLTISSGSAQWNGTNPVWTNSSVGIGTNSPSVGLDINTGSCAPISTNGNPNGTLFVGSAATNAVLTFGVNGVTYAWIQYTHRTSASSGYTLALNPNGGSVTIGTTNPGSYKLNVNGNIRANEVVVNTLGADFVFDSNYKLPDLSKVEKFINDNKHLPDLASALEMQENGMNVSEMQTKLLMKIEEMTLYIIQQNKANELQSNEIESLRKEVALLKAANK